MIGLCFNPECKEELRYLRDGSVYAWKNEGEPERTEFFWLCMACSHMFAVASDENGKPALSPKYVRTEFNQGYFRVRRVLREVVPEDGSQAMPGEPDLKSTVIPRRLDAA